jgi:hypothetical protein
MKVPEIQATAVGIGSSVAAFFVFFGSFNLAYAFCHDWMSSTSIGGILAFLVFRLIPVLFVSRDPTIFRPSARPYMLTPMYALTEVKDALATQYFGERRWQLENVNPEAMSLFYTCKFMQEMGQGEAGTRVETVVSLKVQVSQVGELSTVQLDFDTIAGGVSQFINDLCSDTSSFVENRLLNLQRQLSGPPTQ